VPKATFSIGHIVTTLVTVLIALAIINRVPALKQITGQA